MAYLREYTVRGKKLTFPMFCPDATRGVIRSIDSHDLAATGTEGIIVNTYHLMSEPGDALIEKLGGIHKLMSWNGAVISDSGGFQVLSLIYENPSFGRITDRGVRFIKGSKGNPANYDFTPEKSIQVQFALGSDILICLDDVPLANADDALVEKSVLRTIAWAARCKEEYLRQVEARGLTDETRPLLFGVIQGGGNKALREKCAKGLLEIGFDGYGFGGWPMLPEGGLDADILDFTAKLMPDHLPKYALGVGDLQSVVDCTKMGYTIFDTVLPTRDARHKRLYSFAKDPATFDISARDNFEFLYIKRGVFADDAGPISPFCDCHACKNYSRAYLRHLFSIEDSLAGRLATIHNLRTYAKLIEILRNAVRTSKA